MRMTAGLAAYGIIPGHDVAEIRAVISADGWREIAHGRHARAYANGSGCVLRLAPEADGLVHWLSAIAAGLPPEIADLTPPIMDIALTPDGALAVLMQELTPLDEYSTRLVDLAMQFDWLPAMPAEQRETLEELRQDMPAVMAEVCQLGPLLAELAGILIDDGAVGAQLDIAPVNTMMARSGLVVTDPVSGLATPQAIDRLADRLAAIGEPFPGFRSSYAFWRARCAQDQVMATAP